MTAPPFGRILMPNLTSRHSSRWHSPMESLEARFLLAANAQPIPITNLGPDPGYPDDPILTFYAAATGQLVFEADDASHWSEEEQLDVPIFNPVVQFSPRTSGQYIVEVSGWSPGDYELSFTESRDDHPHAPTPISSPA